MENALFDIIRHDIGESDIVLYMKGTPAIPQDGFSAAVVQILESLGAAYKGINVLTDPELHQALKEFSNWPSVPQLYVKGAFVGGHDRIKELNASGELRALLTRP